MLSADTNLFLYAANPHSPHHDAATEFFRDIAGKKNDFVICELVLVEIYMQLRDPAVLRIPLNAIDAVTFCERLRSNPQWQLVDYEPAVSQALWKWAKSPNSGFRQIIDARLGLTLRFHGVTEFASANFKNFQEFGFDRLWNPVAH
jgi:toxin-antitoxin system PIN domain toxin